MRKIEIDNILPSPHNMVSSSYRMASKPNCCWYWCCLKGRDDTKPWFLKNNFYTTVGCVLSGFAALGILMLFGIILTFIELGISYSFYVTIQYPPICGNITNFTAYLQCSSNGMLTVVMALLCVLHTCPVVGGLAAFIDYLLVIRQKKYFKIYVMGVSIFGVLLSIFVGPLFHKMFDPNSSCGLTESYGRPDKMCFGKIYYGLLLFDGIAIGCAVLIGIIYGCVVCNCQLREEINHLETNSPSA